MDSLSREGYPYKKSLPMNGTLAIIQTDKVIETIVDGSSDQLDVRSHYRQDGQHGEGGKYSFSHALHMRGRALNGDGRNRFDVIHGRLNR